MNGPANFVEEVDCGSFFDHIDDLLDFPTDDIDTCLPAAASSSTGNVNSFPSLWSTRSDSVFSHDNSVSDLSAELSVPYEDIVQLEWLSNFVEDSFSGETLTMNKDESTSINKDTSNQFQTPSPISVLETASSSSGDHKAAPWSPETVAPGKRVGGRSKRPRPSSFVPRLAMQLISPAATPKALPLKDTLCSDSENCAESRLLIKLPKPVAPEGKKKKMKFTIPLVKQETQEVQNVRKCMHCEITKTPQWRAGPMGPKTLCNACGVRYKSGRLFPEYRPAASPTFVPSLHSNSHKKVVEMRNRVCEKTNSAGSMKADSPELIPNDSTRYM